MNRREFLTLRRERGRSVAVLSCEQLYMRWVDARADGTVGTLFDWLSTDLARADRVRLENAAWLADEELRRLTDAVLESMRLRGISVEQKDRRLRTDD